jgi:uncharacterized protein (UPF0297 family)
MTLQEMQLATEILEYLENLQDFEDGKQLIRILTKSWNRALTKQGFNPLDGNQVLRYICEVDPRFNNLVF